MTPRRDKPLVLVAAGGTGGHLFPAEALAIALGKRDVSVDLATDTRAKQFGFAGGEVHVIPSATVRGRSPVALARTASALGLGIAKAWRLLGRLRPDAVVGFGGYPTVPPLLAAAWRGIPTIVHEQNRVMGRANRLLASRVTAIATGFSGLENADPGLAGKTTHTGNPIRPAVAAAAGIAYDPPQPGGPLKLLVFGGSQGAKVMSDIVPDAVARLDAGLRSRVAIVQQARAEDLERVRAAYAAAGVTAEIAPFFGDLPARMAASHLVISRSGAGTVAELAAIGRPGFLVPLPGALDQDQFANAGVLQAANAAIRLPQAEFTSERLAAEIAGLAAAPDRLTAMAAAARLTGSLDAADRLADLVLRIVGNAQR